MKELQLIQVSSNEDRTSEDDFAAREQQVNVSVSKSLTKHSANQSKSEKLAEWEVLPLSSKEQHLEWWKDRLALAGPSGEALLQRLSNTRSPMSMPPMSGSAPRRFPYLPADFTHQSQSGSYRSPSGSNDGSLAETTMLMMPPPPRPSIVGWASGHSSESAGYSSLQTSPQAQQPSPGESAAAGQINASYAWPESMAQQQADMNMGMGQGGGMETPMTSQTQTQTQTSTNTSASPNSSAHRLSSSQWRKFF